MKQPRKLAVVVGYAAAMAWVESAVVYYMRTMIDRIEPYQANPLPVVGNMGPAELVREAATMAMLLAVGLLAGRTWRSRLGYAAVAFGVWDVLYYVYLRVLCGWPHTLFDWDILFLLPLPWWGPVLAPVSIALVLIAWGTLATQFEPACLAGPADWKSRVLASFGGMLALYVFMADSIRVADQGVDVLRNLLPARFNWPLFSVALILMVIPTVQTARQLRWRRPGFAGLETDFGTPG
jgi:hypothetical protein